VKEKIRFFEKWAAGSNSSSKGGTCPTEALGSKLSQKFAALEMGTENAKEKLFIASTEYPVDGRMFNGKDHNGSMKVSGLV
jgi:hypothetical protein